jgi:hypothetical protein
MKQRKCRICGCTDDDCSQCIERTGEPCHWVDQNLCSACKPVITLRQPWAQFIAEGWKTIETRTHDRFKKFAGKDILIHAGAAWDKKWLTLAGPYLSREEIQKTLQWETAWRPMEPQILCKAHVGSFGLVDPSDLFSQGALIDCIKTKRYGLFLNRIEKNKPILIPGAQGLWYYKGRIEI